MNGGLSLIGAILSLLGGASYNRFRDRKTRKLNKKRNSEDGHHFRSEEVEEVYHAVIENRGNSLEESIGSIILFDKCSVSQAKAILVMHELKYRKIPYDPYQVYCLSGYQYEIDAKNGFYK